MCYNTLRLLWVGVRTAKKQVESPAVISGV